MLNTWWEQIKNLKLNIKVTKSFISNSVIIAPTTYIEGIICIGDDTKICHGVNMKGPIKIGKNCVIGNNVVLRGPCEIGDNVQLGFATEVKNSIIQNNVLVGPMCFIGDSIVHSESFLGAMVRTTNFRLDKETVKVYSDIEIIDTGMIKLGSNIGFNCKLGANVITLPGRIVPPNTSFGPGIIIDKNYVPGNYFLKQSIKVYEK